MKRNRLILLTAGFPYGRSEPFLEAEIPYLAKVFSEVLVYCPQSAASSTTVRDLPGNVRVVCLEQPPVCPKGSLKFFELLWAVFGDFLDCIRYYGVFPRRAAVGAFKRYWVEALDVAGQIEKLMVQKDINPSELVIYSYWLTPTALAGCFLKRCYPTLKVVARCHGWDVYFERSSLGYLPLRSYLLQRLDKLFCVSGHGAAYLDNKTGYRHSAALETRYLGVQPTNTRNEVSPVSTTDFHIVTCARVIPLKRLDLMVDALRRLAEKPGLPMLTWTHLGGGEIHFDNLKARAKSILGDLRGVNCRFMGDLPNAGVHDFYKTHQVHLFVSTSETEGLPVSMMEAAAYGLPILATAVGGVPEIVRDGYNGRLLNANPSSEEVAIGLEFFIRLPAIERLAMGNRSSAVWQSSFNADITLKDFAEEIAGR